ncbi:MAG: DNA-directed DNA polymerase [Candidatus Micrarchaeota archaeon]|nr:DNA-directed DNA polymerase [Candidatus Micrarchaeota archaeon]
MPRAFLLDVGYGIDARLENGVDVASIRLTLRGNGKVLFKSVRFSPYFYFVGELEKEFTDVPQIKSIEKVRMRLGAGEVSAYKITCYNPSDTQKLRPLFDKFGKCYEFDIPFVRRFMIDTGIRVFTMIDYVELDDTFIEVKGCTDELAGLNMLSFDIETYNPKGMPRPREDPIVMISHSDGVRAGVITYGASNNKRVARAEDEKGMLEMFCQLVRDKGVDVLFGYNSSDFDLPYMRDRAQALRAQLALGRDNSSFTLRRQAFFSTASVYGRLHIDVFHMIRFLATIGALKTNTYSLGDVYREVFGEEKKMISKMDIWKMWNAADERERLIEYSLDDAAATYKLGVKFLPIFIEIARIASITVEDAVSSTTGQLVDYVLLKEAHARGIIAPNRPRESELMAREDEPIEGAYVKVPTPGVYNNIIVFDFRSLYPSIIVAHNISPETLNCTCCNAKEAHVAPDGSRFCSKRRGLIPDVLSRLLEHRAALKRQMKSLDKGSQEYTYAYARQYAFKIIANTFYGMLRNIRARWYCRECAAATTAWERFYIQDVISRAEKEGFNVLYADTDSLFILLDNKAEKDALSFMDKVNKSLPEGMELELEDYYTRGIFVSKKAGSSGAKKKYALLSRSGRIKIRGFELVRRDWSQVAGETQRRVLESVLKGGDIGKALQIVNSVIQELRERKVPKEKLVIYTLLRKGLDEYRAMGPEVAAAIKARERGKDIGEGMMVGYIITSKGRSISEKAELEEYVEEGDYDPDYYINNQVIPVVESILGELGYSGDLLKSGKKQQGLDDWL